MEPTTDTLADRLIRRLKNNPLVAVLLAAAVVISAVAAIWGAVPESWRRSFLPTKKEASAGPQNGWLFAGYLDRESRLRWASPSHVRVVRTSGAADRPYPIRVGDVVTPTSPRPQVIVGYRSSGTANVLQPPVQLVEQIRPSEDYTARTLQPGELFEVAHVDVSGLKGSDLSVWLRLIPHTQPHEK